MYALNEIKGAMNPFYREGSYVQLIETQICLLEKFPRFQEA